MKVIVTLDITYLCKDVRMNKDVYIYGKMTSTVV